VRVQAGNSFTAVYLYLLVALLLPSYAQPVLSALDILMAFGQCATAEAIVRAVLKGAGADYFAYCEVDRIDVEHFLEGIALQGVFAKQDYGGMFGALPWGPVRRKHFLSRRPFSLL
jgi:hypothetical protein